MEIKNYTDYIDQVREKFPTLSKGEINTVLKYGFRMFASLNMSGLDTFHRNFNFVAYVGKFFNDGLTFYHYWRLKYKKKLRYLYRKKKTIYDGYYYFGLTEKEYQAYLAQINTKGNRRQKFYFPYVYGYKIKEEAFLDRYRRYFFKVSFPVDVGWILYKEKWAARNVTLIATRDDEGNIKYIENNGKGRKNR